MKWNLKAIIYMVVNRIRYRTRNLQTITTELYF